MKKPLNIGADFSVPKAVRWELPKTLGNPSDEAEENNRIACDTAMNLIGHSMALGQLPVTASFLGYAVLQDISQNGLIRACIETVADDMTRAFGEVKGDDAEVVDTMTRAFDNFKVQELLHEVAEKVGYFGGCLVFIDTGADDAELLLPLSFSPESIDFKRGVKALRVIDPINVYPGTYNSVDPLKPGFFEPKDWFVMGKRVHASRLIRFVANEVPQLLKPVYNFFGIPQAQILWDYVIHFNTVREATANLARKFSMTVLKTSMDAVLFDAAGYGQMDKRISAIARYQDNNSITAIDKDSEDIVKVESSLAGITDIARQALEFLAAINRTPAVKLLGISPSGFNATGESDIRNYYDHIVSQQEKVFGFGVKRILDALFLSIYGQKNTTLTFEFNALGEEDEAAMASTERTKADTAAVYIDRGVLAPEEVRQALANDTDGQFAFIDPTEVPEFEDGEEEEFALAENDSGGTA